MLSELVQAGLTGLPLSDAGTHATGILAAPKGIDTSGILTFLASKIAPILLAVLGVIFIGRASQGEISQGADQLGHRHRRPGLHRRRGDPASSSATT